jgi:hypothetical protein
MKRDAIVSGVSAAVAGAAMLFVVVPVVVTLTALAVYAFFKITWTLMGFVFTVIGALP